MAWEYGPLVTASLSGYQEGLTGEVHESIRPDVELLFNDYGGRSMARINNNIVQQSYKNDLQTIVNEATALTEEGLQAARDGDVDMLIKVEARLGSMLDQGVKSRLITEQDATERKRHLADMATQESMIGEFNKILYNICFYLYTFIYRLSCNLCIARRSARR